MDSGAAMFFFAGAAVVSVFAFLSIAVWVSGPAHEREVRYRMDLLRNLAEQEGDNAARVLEYLREEDRKKEQRRKEEERRGYIMGGLILMAMGAGTSILLAMVAAGGMWAAGLILVLIGCVLAGTGTSIRRA